jgi:hypothetical protein
MFSMHNIKETFSSNTLCNVIGMKDRWDGTILNLFVDLSTMAHLHLDIFLSSNLYDAKSVLYKNIQ